MLRKGAGSEATRAKLKRGPKQSDRGRSATCTNKNINTNYMAMRATALPPMVRLLTSSVRTVVDNGRSSEGGAGWGKSAAHLARYARYQLACLDATPAAPLLKGYVRFSGVA